jgi:hypothetical protein
MLSHDRFRTPPLLRTDSTRWHTTGQLLKRWFFSLADGARAKEVSSKRKGLGPELAVETRPTWASGQSGYRLARELPAQIVERPLRGPRADTVAVAE